MQVEISLLRTSFQVKKRSENASEIKPVRLALWMRKSKHEFYHNLV